MIFTATEIPGLNIVQLEKKEDERGFLARSFDLAEFKKQGCDLNIVQGYTSLTEKKGTMRGLHYSLPPAKDTKLVRVIRGSFYEVVVDLRPDSSAFMKWWGMTVKALDYKMVIVPPNCAHAVLSLEDDCEHMMYYTEVYDSTHEAGIRYDDPTFAISLPRPVEIVSEKDKAWPDFQLKKL